ncbi:UvrB/UvrC motif-containing protein [Candidatus Berkelbacteria bacterium]|nr:UvrB/UvrC motif-containing protein [Candidatus Berkelbacteria bacterium]
MSILYVGKATSLRARVGSYWLRPLDERLSRMLPMITTIRIQTTDSALEALILEANEITRLNPPVNQRGKDGKTFSQIVLTRERYPTFLIHRPTQQLTVPIDRSFGPYVSGYAARQALAVLQRIFQVQCRGTPNSGRPCLYFQIGRCPGICLGRISPTQYRRRINSVVQFLEGKKHRIIQNTRRSMSVAARHQDYETAAQLRDQLFGLEHIHDTAFMTDDATEFLVQSLPARLEAYDISNLGRTAAVASMAVLEFGRPNPSQYRRFKIRTVPTQNDVAMIREVIQRRLHHPEWPNPDFLLIDGGLAQQQAAQQVLNKEKKTIPVSGVVKGPDRKGARLVPSPLARQWLADHRLTTQLFEPVVRLARDEAHRFAIRYHRHVRSKRM